MILRKLRRIASRLLAKAHSVDVTTVTWFSPGPSQHLMSSARKIAPFGSWPSPLNAAEVTANSTRLEEVRIDSAKSAGDRFLMQARSHSNSSTQARSIGRKCAHRTADAIESAAGRETATEKWSNGRKETSTLELASTNTGAVPSSSTKVKEKRPPPPRRKTIDNE